MTSARGPERQPAAVGPKALDRALLRILDARRQPVGVGFLVSDTVALTCAHVVSAALGTPAGTPPQPGARVSADLLLVPTAPHAHATVEVWVPPREVGGAAAGVADVAVLRLAAPLPGAGPVRLVDADESAVAGEPADASADDAAGGLWGHRVRAFGLPSGRPGGVWHAGVLRGRQADGWVQADLAGAGYPVSRGFSGGPVWDDRLAGVVGMVTVAESGQPPVSYLIPTSTLVAARPELGPLVLPSSPFRGLAAFEEADAAVFHGRRHESDRVARALDEQQWVTVVGPSGSGKSSLALAGVAPRLRARGACVVVMRPASGSSPLAALASAVLPQLEPDLAETRRLARIPQLTDELRRHGLAAPAGRLLQLQGGRQLLIVVDQLEELLPQHPDAVRDLTDVLFAADALPPTVRVLTTMRADFLEPVLGHQHLGPVTGRHLHALGPLGKDGLRAIVTTHVDTLPGVSYEPHLAERILADTGTEPGALPLLALTLDLLWQRQTDGVLTHRAYDELGGVTGALGNHADRVWAEHVPPNDEATARRLFTQLVRLPLGAAAATRRLARRSDLSEDQWGIAQRLAAHTRLLVTDRGAEGTETVELTHEALIAEWPKLAAWVAEDRSFLGWRDTVQHEMDRWQEADRAPEHLPTTAAMAGADQWLPERAAALSVAERDYLTDGRTHRRARARRRRALFSALATALTLALVLGMLYVVERRSSQESAALGASRALAQAAQETTSTDPARAALLSLAAYDTSPTQEAKNELLRQYLQHKDYDRVLSGELGETVFDKSRDGDVVLAASKRSGATLFVAALTGPVRTVRVPSTDKVQYVMVSADGKRAAYVQYDGKAAWFEVRPDAKRPAGPVHRLPNAPGIGTNWSDTVTPAMSLDGTMIVAHVRKRIVRWNLDNGPHGTLAGNLPAPKGLEFKIWPAPDNRTLLVPVYKRFRDFGQGEKGSLLALDLVTGRSRLVVRADADQIRISGDRTRAVLCHVRGNTTEVTVHRVSDGSREGTAYREKNADFASSACMVQSVDQSGLRVALNSLQGLSVVDMRDGKVLSRNGLPASTSSLATSSPWLVEADGRLYYVRHDESMIGFVQLRPGYWFLDVAQQLLTRDGKYTITVLADGSRIQRHHARKASARVLADAPRRKPHWVPERSEPLALDRTGRLVADREGANIVTVRDATTLRRTTAVTAVQPPRLPDSAPIADIEIGDDDNGSAERPKYDFTYFFDRGDKLVTVSGTVVEQWDPRTGRRLARFDAAAVRSRAKGAMDADLMIGPYPATNRVAVVVLDRPGIHIVDITTGRTTETVKTGDDILAAQFDATGTYFAILRRGSVLELWRRGKTPHKEIGPLRSIAESESTPYAAGFLEGGGRYLVAANNSVRVYRIGEPGYETFYSFTGPRDSALDGQHSFMGASADGSTVLHIGPDGTGGALHLAPGQWYRELCTIIGDRELTPGEADLLPADPRTRKPCGEDD
ncbi:serine protease (plasmid) [Streptomyces sp. NBC_01717]|uniref:nSTAND1 domain-containing NTPase n=1 Tax=Streptomyces sp. NBC_01717 TaxID=2975918 RepID=UPI002E31E934|nr:trypsin-like peptidase domain-containing protein [Streptomyces sp. NBC_01717]